MSMPTVPCTSRFAVVTHRLPGPAITSTAGRLGVPYARAAMAQAPPTRYTSRTPAMRAAARMAGFNVPSRRGGETTATSSTPATRAGIAVISRLDTSGVFPPVPPGT